MTLEIDPNSVNRVINDISSFSGNLIEPNIQWIVGGFVPGSLGEKHGLKVGDQITLVNKMKTSFYNNEIREYLQSQANQSILLTILRDGDISQPNLPRRETFRIDKPKLRLGVPTSSITYSTKRVD